MGMCVFIHVRNGYVCMCVSMINQITFSSKRLSGGGMYFMWIMDLFSRKIVHYNPSSYVSAL